MPKIAKKDGYTVSYSFSYSDASYAKMCEVLGKMIDGAVTVVKHAMDLAAQQEARQQARQESRTKKVKTH